MKMSRLFFPVVMAACLSMTSAVGTLHGGPVRSSLPTPSTAKEMLSNTTRHREWVSIPVGSASMLAFVVYPERVDRAPGVLVTLANETANVPARAVADQLAAEGFISIVPDDLTGLEQAEVRRRYEGARDYVAGLPAANGTTAHLHLDFDNRQAVVSSHVNGSGGTKDLPLTASAWPQVVAQLSRLTGNHPTFLEPSRTSFSGEHGMHMGHALMPVAAQQASGSTAPRMIPGLADKQSDLPASYYTATATLARSKLKKEWVDIPLGDVKLHTWVEYPDGNDKTGVVIVMQHGVGLDDWMRSVGDQLAQQGFIAVAPDAWSGTGPNGGNRDSFEFDDDAMRAAARITPDETIRRYKTAREWALKLPRANGKTGSIGFCAGGNNSFRFAGEVPDLNAAAVFYGTVPSQDLAAKINAPVLGFYGENDARVTASVQPTIELMKKLGKSYEPHVYPKVTHSFVYFQDLGDNRHALADAWPRVIAFFNKYLK
jgi:carboxymethylenebutenolidase